MVVQRLWQLAQRKAAVNQAPRRPLLGSPLTNARSRAGATWLRDQATHADPSERQHRPDVAQMIVFHVAANHDEAAASEGAPVPMSERRPFTTRIRS